MEWITDWSKIDDDKLYFLCPIYKRKDGTFNIEGPIPGFHKGWSVKRLMEKCYAALEVPEWTGVG